MAVTVADLEKGRSFPSVTFEMSRDWVDAYVAATGDAAIRELSEEAVPPMAIATLAIRALLQNAGLTPGTIHAGQELAFHRATHIGDAVSVDARVVSRGERQGWVLMSIDLEANGASGLLMSGRATITFPLEDAA